MINKILLVLGSLITLATIIGVGYNIVVTDIGPMDRGIVIALFLPSAGFAIWKMVHYLMIGLKR